MASRQTSVVTSAGDDKIEVREATPGDYEGVLAISENIYDGIDYLPKIYHPFIQNPKANFYVLLKNDKIVAFKSFHLAESGDYCTSMAVRVAESERGQGMMEKLHKNALHLLNLKHKSIKNVVMTAIWHTGVQAHVQRSKTAQVVHKGNFFLYKLASAKPAFSTFLDKSEERGSSEFSTKLLSSQEIQQLIKQPVINKVVPGKMVMYSECWLPEFAKEKIVQMIMTEYSDAAVASFHETTNEVVSFSYLKQAECPHGYRNDIHYHGNDLSDLVSHVTIYARHLLEIRKDSANVAILLFFPGKIKAEDVEEALSSIDKPIKNKLFPVSEYVIIQEENN